MATDPASSLLRELVGSELGSVVFVQDYLQLVFQPATVGPAAPGTLVPPMTGVFGTFTAYTLPALEDVGRLLRAPQPGYRDMLVEQIGRRVAEADETEERLRVVFDGGVVATISLGDDDLVDRLEAAMLQVDDDQRSWMVWRPADRLG